MASTSPQDCSLNASADWIPDALLLRLRPDELAGLTRLHQLLQLRRVSLELFRRQQRLSGFLGEARSILDRPGPAVSITSEAFLKSDGEHLWTPEEADGFDDDFPAAPQDPARGEGDRRTPLASPVGPLLDEAEAVGWSGLTTTGGKSQSSTAEIDPPATSSRISMRILFQSSRPTLDVCGLPVSLTPGSLSHWSFWVCRQTNTNSCCPPDRRSAAPRTGSGAAAVGSTAPAGHRSS